MPRPIAAHIHVEALAHNLRRAREAAPEARVWAVVKANAYGHRIALAYAGLQGADGFALLDLDEAEQVRALGWRGPILLLEGCFTARDLEACSRLDLWHVVHHEAQIERLAAHKTDRPQHVFLKMNSGMNRLGFRPAAFRSAWQRLHGLTQVASVTLMTHWADADAGPAGDVDATATSVASNAAGSAAAGAVATGAFVGDSGAARAAAASFVPANSAARCGIAAQLAVFDAATRDLPGDRSLCNSAATLRYGADPAVGADWIRPGIMLYGSSPDFPGRSSADWRLRPAMTLRSEVIATQDLQAGESVGYGSRFRADRPMRIGVVACGYADGYPRVAPNGTPVLIDGVRTALVGRVSMDMITVDLTPVPAARLGSEATLWGCGPNGAVLAIDEVAQAAGTIGYELMCALAARVPTTAV